MDSDQIETMHEVLVNDEGQYSLWVATKTIPVGWHKTGKKGTREDCLSHINEVWTDMRPVSLRRQMSAQHSLAMERTTE